MPVFFRTSNQESFYRQLRFYKFRRLKKSTRVTYYYHRNFKRNQFNEFCFINKVTNKPITKTPKCKLIAQLVREEESYKQKCQAKLEEINYFKTYTEALINENKEKIFECIDLKSKFQGIVKRTLLAFYTKNRFLDINFDVELNALIDNDETESDKTTIDQAKAAKKEVPRVTFAVAQQLIFFPTNRRPVINKIAKVTLKHISQRIMGSDEASTEQELNDFFFNNITSDNIANSEHYTQLVGMKAFMEESARTILDNASPNYDFIESYDLLKKGDDKKRIDELRGLSFDNRSFSGLSTSMNNLLVDADFSVFMTPKKGD